MWLDIYDLEKRLINNNISLNVGKLTILTILVIVFSAELRIHPFDTPFRIGLGVITFAFAALYFKKISLWWLTFGVASLVLLFRTVTDIYFLGEGMETVLANIPGAAYYLIFGTLIKLTKMRSYQTRPLFQGMVLGLLDFSSNVSELLLRWVFVAEPLVDHLILWNLTGLLIVGLIRMLLVTGVYSSIHQYYLQAVNQVERRKRTEILLITSELQSEVFFLQKSTQDIDGLVWYGYNLYEQLIEQGKQDLAANALNISTQTHEIKKDYERIITGLRRLLKPPSLKGHSFKELVDLMIGASNDYSQKLAKQVEFLSNIGQDFYPVHPMTLVSIINNLVTNSVDAITNEGKITISASVDHEDSTLNLAVADTGPGINSSQQELIFETGYSCKPSERGSQAEQLGERSNGLGLTHVQNLIDFLEGSWSLTSEAGKGTTFYIQLPTKNIVEEWFHDREN